MIKPDEIYKEYSDGIQFKTSIGNKGMFEQSKINERFYSGDQWHGAKCGTDRPLVRYNVIKRIGDYKISMIGSSPIAVNYSADGVPNTLELKDSISAMRDQAATTGATSITEDEIPESEEINLVMSALSDYYRVTSERLGFDEIRADALRNAYTSGTGIIYTYWDKNIRTGLYADAGRKKPIEGDICDEVIDIENVYFGDPTLDDVQKQPFIIIAQRKYVKDLKAEAKENGMSAENIELIGNDRDNGYMAGDRSELEPSDSKKATVLTRFWKEKGMVKACKVTKNAIVRNTWDLNIRLYPLAKFSWDKRKNSAYGESEVTYLIPNQIAINRMVTASVWAVMMMGMPIMLVNSDVVIDPVTNDPAQIITVNSQSDLNNAISYVVPPNFSPNFDNNITSLVSQTLSQAGANDAVLGDLNAENTSAIIAVREAATLPLQTMQNRYYKFCEDCARIWSEYWIMQYGKRALKVEDEKGTWYMPFDGDRYKDLIISTRVDVGASTLWSEAQSIRTLDNLFDRQIIDAIQYLQRIPKGIISDNTGLIKELKSANEMIAKQTAQNGLNQPTTQPEDNLDIESVLSSLPQEQQDKFKALPREQQQALVEQAAGGAQQ